MNAVFLDYATFSAGLDISIIEKSVSKLECYDFTKQEDIVSRAKNAQIIITNKVILNETLMAQLPELRLICIAATGTNNVDLEAASKLNIAVTNAKDYAGPAVAQYIFSQLLVKFQDVAQHNNDVRQGKWSESQSFCLHGNPITELFGKTFGIVGYGHIGKTVANIAKAFGMKVLISERPLANPIRKGRVCFEEMLAQADIVSLHCPLTPNTKRLINRDTLKQMKSSAILINTARGDLVDSQALKSALINNEISFAILDVLEQEPPLPTHALLNSDIPNIAITGHIAWASMQAQQRLIKIIAQSIVQYSSGTLVNQVN